MSLLSGIELLSVLVVIGVLLLLGARLRTRMSTAILLLIITLLLLALISLGKLTMALFTAALFLGALLILFVWISIRRIKGRIILVRQFSLGLVGLSSEVGLRALGPPGSICPVCSRLVPFPDYIGSASVCDRRGLLP